MIDSSIITEIKLLTASLKKAMTEQIDNILVNATTDLNFYKFMNWAIDQNFNNDPSLLNNIVCGTSNSRHELETYSEYKDRQYLVRKCAQYRKYFMPLLIEKYKWNLDGKDKTKVA